MKTPVTEPVNKQVILIARPEGIPQAHHFQIVQSQVPPLAEGQVRIRNVYWSVEPAMRGWVSAVGNYADPVALGAVMRSFTAGVVEASRAPGLPVGTWVTGMFGWQTHAVVAAEAVSRRIHDRDLPMSTALGILGINGTAAHHGLLTIGQPRPGETVVVSTAAGAVGSCVGQIAKIKGCRAVGITGGETKRRLCLDRFGYDAVVDYKAAAFAEQFAATCPEGVDVYFDNTAGAISDTVLMHLNRGARVVVCGTASVSSWDPPPLGPRVERHLLVKRARMEGFVIFDHADSEPAALLELGQWLREGRLNYQEEVLDGIEHAPDAIAGLYRGENLGKRLIRVGAV